MSNSTISTFELFQRFPIRKARGPISKPNAGPNTSTTANAGLDVWALLPYRLRLNVLEEHMRLLIAAGIVCLLICAYCLVSIILTVNDTCGTNQTCRVEMEAPQ